MADGQLIFLPASKMHTIHKHTCIQAGLHTQEQISEHNLINNVFSNYMPFLH